MSVISSISPTIPESPTRDSVIDAYIQALSDAIEDRKQEATAKGVAENELLYHAMMELKMVRDFTKQEVAGRIGVLKALDDAETNHLRDASLEILRLVGHTIKKYTNNA